MSGFAGVGAGFAVHQTARGICGLACKVCIMQNGCESRMVPLLAFLSLTPSHWSPALYINAGYMRWCLLGIHVTYIQPALMSAFLFL